MDAVVFLFPLLHLPSKASTNVLKTMETIDLIAFSLISKYTRSLVVSLKFKSKYRLRISLQETFNLTLPLQGSRINFILNKRASPTDRNSKLTVADTIEVTKYDYWNFTRNATNTVYQWTKPGYGIREWISHLKNVTNRLTIDSIGFCPQGERYDIGSVAKTIKGLGVCLVVAAYGCPKPYARLIHETILTSWIRLLQNPYPDRVTFQKVLMSNNNLIDISFAPSISLEELLVMNCKYLCLSMPAILKMETLNKFLKIWKTGRFDTKLKYMLISFGERVYADLSVILKGIPHNVVDRALKREFAKQSRQIVPRSEMKGGYDIRGANGMTVTLFVVWGGGIELFIWK